jgi:hypothetical protein
MVRHRSRSGPPNVVAHALVSDGTPPPAFSVDVRPERDVVRVCPVGEVDLDTVGVVRAQLDELTVTVVCTLEDALLAASGRWSTWANSSGSVKRACSSRSPPAPKFVCAVEETLYRKVRAFASATDPDAAVVFEVFALEPIESSCSHDGRGPE